VKGGLGGHAAAATPEARKKQRIVGAAIGAAAVLAIVASLAGDHRVSMTLFGIAAGLMFVGVVYIFTNRRPR
jgi:ABC-type Fe3+-siderophore transport system permease subunit